MKKVFISLYLNYIKFFAGIQLKKISPLIIGVGGSSGKSSLAYLVSLTLKNKFKVKESRGKNSETGIPLDILGIDIKSYDYLSWFKTALLAPIKIITNNEKYDIYVAELGIDSPVPPKNMEYLLSFIKPDIGVLTNISIEHSQNFDFLVSKGEEGERKKEIIKLISRQEGLLLKSLSEKSKAIVNLDDENIKELLPLKSNTILVSKKEKATDFKIIRIRVEEDKFDVEFIFLKEKYSINLKKALPKYYSTTLILDIAVCFSVGIRVKDAIAILEEKFNLPPGRFSIFNGIKDTTIIDSSYNSSLESALGALEVMEDIGRGRRRVGILGDMRELGSLSKIQHEKLAENIVKYLDFAIIIGPNMKKFVSPILTKSKLEHITFIIFKEAKREIEKNIKKGDVVLIKGSQNELFLERATEMLLLDKADIQGLPRRGKFWDKKRKNSN